MLRTSAVRRHEIDRKAEVCGSIGRRAARGFPCGFAYGTIGDTTTREVDLGTGVAAMKARKIRRWVVAVLAAAAVAAGVFASTAQSSADDMDWHMTGNQSIIR
jgi:hypothetical protein